MENNTLALALNEAQKKFLEGKIFRSRWKSLRASGLDDTCDRRLFYYMTAGELAAPAPIERIAIFEEGKDQEPGVRRYLSELGFEVMKAQSTENWDKFNISGQIDGVMVHEKDRVLVEIKTVSDYGWDALNTIDDFQKEDYYRKWYGQMQLYLLLFGYERGVFIFKKKSAKLLKAIEVGIDYNYAERLLKKAEIVNKAISTNTPPEFIKNPVECRKCPFFGVTCNPPMDFGDAIVNIDDSELATKLARREELSAPRSEYEKLDKEIKERFKEIPNVICGDFHVTGKAGEINYKAQEARTVATWKTKIERITPENAATI